MDKYEDGKCHKGYFCRVINIDLNLITCEDNIITPSILQKYVLHWYQTYLIHPQMDRTEAMICQHFYCPDIIHDLRKEVNNGDTCQGTKRSNKKKW